MELWDIYDACKKPTGRTMRKNDWRLQAGEYHLTVLGVIKNAEGNYLITKRTAGKAWAAGWWEVPGGAVLAGESSDTAVRREVLEETGLDVADAAGGYSFSYCRENPDEGDNYFVDIYTFTLDFVDSDVKIRPDEADAFEIATADRIKELAEQGIFLHYSSIKQALA